MQERISAQEYLKRVNEHGEQEALIRRCKMSYAEYPELRLLFAIPNGGLRDKRVAAKLKAEGVRAGVPDLCLPIARKGYHALYIEMKTDRGRVSIEQRAWIEVLKKNGNQAVTCYSQEDAWEALKDYLQVER